MVQPILYYLSLALFAIAAGVGVWALRAPAPLRVRALRGLLGAAAASVIVFLAARGAAERAFPAATLFDSLLWVTFLTAAAGIGADIGLRIPALSLAASAAGAAALLTALFVSPRAGLAQELLSNRWVGLHIVCMLLAYAAFGLGCLAGALYLFEETCLKRKLHLALLGSLPSLETLDAVEGRVIAAGLALFTIGLLVGYQEQRILSHYAKDWRMDPKVIATAVTWLAYFGVVVARRTSWLRGRKVAYLTVLGFAFVLFTYLGANYLSAGFHSF